MPVPKAQLSSQCSSAIAALDADRVFLRAANHGAEAMGEADMQRVRDIGQGRRCATSLGWSRVLRAPMRSKT